MGRRKEWRRWNGALACDATWIDVEVSTAIGARETKGWTIGCGNVKGTSLGVNQDWPFVLFPNVDVTESAV